MPHSVSISQSSSINDSLRSVSITINLSAIRANLATARRCSKNSKVFATIKADAYGHGAVAVATALSPVQDGKPEPEHADGFAVVSVNEAIELRQAGIKQPVLVMQGPQTIDACVELKRHELWPVIHDLQQYQWYAQCVQRAELSAWLKVDTGMGRLGVQPADAVRILANKDGIRWCGLMTHFACADEVDNAFTRQQIEQFNAISHNGSLERSMANSSAVLAWPQARADWARPGIMLYGCNPLDRELPKDIGLIPAMTVTAPLISVKNMTSGSGVGYAQSYQCPEDMPIGYVALGYRDGIARVLSDSACVYINGARCPIVGRVSMDSVAVDLRAARDTQPGDVAEFWGNQAPIDALAEAAGTINYELLTSIRGQRQYVE